MTPKQAFKDGATSLVIGRSLTSGNLKKHQKTHSRVKLK